MKAIRWLFVTLFFACAISVFAAKPAGKSSDRFGFSVRMAGHRMALDIRGGEDFSLIIDGKNFPAVKKAKLPNVRYRNVQVDNLEVMGSATFGAGTPVYTLNAMYRIPKDSGDLIIEAYPRKGFPRWRKTKPNRVVAGRKVYVDKTGSDVDLDYFFECIIPRKDHIYVIVQRTKTGKTPELFRSAVKTFKEEISQ